MTATPPRPQPSLTDLLDTIKTGLVTGAHESRIACADFGRLASVDPEITDALAALAQLRALLIPPEYELTADERRYEDEGWKQIW